MSHLLYFLHFRVGVIQYFDMDGLVVIKPQLIFNKVTRLVKTTFSCKSLTSKELRNLQKGILTASVIKLIVREDGIDSEKFLRLLTRLHMITPLSNPEDEEEKYFMPCVLNHVQGSCKQKLHTDVLPLYIQFRCEHCPKGLFGVLVAHLMALSLHGNTPDSHTCFNLIEDKIFRDQVSFEVCSMGVHDEMSLKAFPSHFEVLFFPELSQNRDTSVNKVCNEVREIICASIAKSLAGLRYNETNLQPAMCFKCDICSELHPVERGVYYKIHCKRARKTSPIPLRGRCWYNEGQ